MHSLGAAALAVGSVAALAAEAVALWGTATDRWRLIDCQKDPVFQRWFFGGLGLVLGGAILLALS